tara:strand:- start:267 stop:425 length:159 start_codon:yes stop_codon:yes gene_type:complete
MPIKANIIYSFPITAYSIFAIASTGIPAASLFISGVLQAEGILQTDTILGEP